MKRLLTALLAAALLAAGAAAELPRADVDISGMEGAAAYNSVCSILEDLDAINGRTVSLRGSLWSETRADGSTARRIVVIDSCGCRETSVDLEAPDLPDSVWPADGATVTVTGVMGMREKNGENAALLTVTAIAG